MIVAGFLFCSVSAYMAGLIGSSNNPVSGITIAHDHFRVARADCSDGPRRAARPGRGDHDRRRRLLRGRSRGRQSPGPQGGTDRRRDAVAATGDARDRRRLVRVRDGAGAQPAREGLRDRRADGGASEPAARAAGDSHGVGVEGHVRRRAAVGHGLDRRGDRGRDHRRRRDPQGARRALSRAGARGVVRHLPAARVHRADLPRRAASRISSSERATSAATPTRSSACTVAACCSRRA